MPKEELPGVDMPLPKGAERKNNLLLEKERTPETTVEERLGFMETRMVTKPSEMTNTEILLYAIFLKLDEILENLQDKEGEE